VYRSLFFASKVCPHVSTSFKFVGVVAWRETPPQWNSTFTIEIERQNHWISLSISPGRCDESKGIEVRHCQAHSKIEWKHWWIRKQREIWKLIEPKGSYSRSFWTDLFDGRESISGSFDVENRIWVDDVYCTQMNVGWSQRRQWKTEDCSMLLNWWRLCSSRQPWQKLQWFDISNIDVQCDEQEPRG